MAINENEEELLQSVALKNAKSILLARQRAEQDLVHAKEALEGRSAQLAQSLSLVRATLESTADGIKATDQAGRITEFNEKFIAMWGLPRAMVESRNHRQVLIFMSSLVRKPAPFVDAIGELLSESPAERLDVLELNDGRVFEQFTRVQQLEGRIVGRVWSYRDITERAQVEAALRDAKDAAEAANRAKSDFLAVMSHELRTPLNAIGGYVELLGLGIRGPITPLQRDDLDRIQKSQRHLLGLINEVLNYARLETGTLQYDMRDVTVREALVSAEGLVAPQVWEKGLSMEVLACPDDLVLKADPEKLQQILLNLLSNAVKFTPEGRKIDLACEPAGDRVAIHIRDTGIGIPPDKVQAIFEPFIQVKSDLMRTSEGTGLGLAISRDLARGMGGDLTVQSSIDAGSTFSLTLARVMPEPSTRS